MNRKIFLLIIFAFFIRLIAINQSLWLDEATTAKVVQNFRFIEIVTKFLPHDFHPPLYYLFIKFWVSLFGISEIALRMPSILFSLLTGWVIYKISRLHQGSGEAMWTAAFFLFNPLIIYYSQEARMYLMTTCLLTIGLYYLLTSLRVNELKKEQGFLIGLFLCLALLTFYGSIFFIAAILIYLLWKKNYKIFIVLCFTLFVTLLMLSPLLLKQLTNAKQSLQIVANWSLVLGKANLKNLILIPIKFTSGRISFEPKKIYYLIASLWLLITSYFFIKGARKNALLLLCFLVTLLLGFIFSFFTPLLQYFRFLYLIVPMSILISLGCKKNWQRYLILSGFLVFSLVYLLCPQFHREDWKSLSRSITAKSIVYAVPSSMDSLFYYRNDLRSMVKDLRLLKKSVNKIIVIPYTSEIYGIDYKSELLKKNYKLKKTDTFRGLSVEYWDQITVNQLTVM